MTTQYEEAIRQKIITECGFPPPVIAPHIIKQIHADCAAKVAHEYERTHKLEKTADVAGDIITAPLGLLANPIFLFVIVLVIVIFIGWGLKSGVQSKVGG